VLADCVVPKVVGKTLRSARRAIRKRHCRTGKITRAFSVKVTTGRVIAQRPKASKKLPNGAKVRLVVSRGRRR
jgi:beta-lactam-binding protein with PASTA domain